MTGLRSAIGFLTLLPVGSRDSVGLASARGWFPVVGLFLGAVLAAIELLMHWGYPIFIQDVRSFPPLLAAVILVVAMIALTRALHLDGFMDCCDGLLGSFDRVRRLEIMRDPHVSAGGYVNRCVNDIRRRPSQPLIQWRFHPHTVHRDRRLRSTQGPSDA